MTQINLEGIRDEMLSGLRPYWHQVPSDWNQCSLDVQAVASFGQSRKWGVWNYTGDFVPATKALSLPLAVAAGAAAVVIRNPTVTRRFWK